MHKALLNVPNTLYYENRIKSEYVPPFLKRFMYAFSPFLFIDVPNGTQKLKGTSFYNDAEVKVINQLKDFCLQKFEESVQRYEEDKRDFSMKFTKSSIYVITPYNAQRNLIAEDFSEQEMAD